MVSPTRSFTGKRALLRNLILIVLACFSLALLSPSKPSSSGSNRARSKVPQILEFIEPTTNVKVVLVGAMHYNPNSIRLARSTVEALGQQEQLGSVIVESCPIRWNKTASIQQQSRFKLTMGEEEKEEKGKKGTALLQRVVLNNEMRAASNAAISFSRPVVLGDQLINVTNARIAESARKTVMDLLNPRTGWQALYRDVKAAVDVSLPGGPTYLGLPDFFESNLLLAAPVSLFRYPLAFVLKAPQVAIPVLLLLTLAAINPDFGSLASSLSDAAATVTAATTGVADLSVDVSSSLSTSTSMVPPAVDTLQDLAYSVAAFTLEVAFLSRIFLVAILAERNEVLAENILWECQKIAAMTNEGTCRRTFYANEESSAQSTTEVVESGGRSAASSSAPASASFLSGAANRKARKMKLPFSLPSRFPQQQKPGLQVAGERGAAGDTSESTNSQNASKTVVAVLGMAHCNGIKKLLEERRVVVASNE